MLHRWESKTYMYNLYGSIFECGSGNWIQLYNLRVDSESVRLNVRITLYHSRFDSKRVKIEN